MSAASAPASVPSSPPGKSNAMRTFTRDELAKNVGTRFAEDDRASSDKMLMAIGGYVYDVTKFEKLHPGGRAVLRMLAGEDATEQFYALHNQDVFR